MSDEPKRRGRPTKAAKPVQAAEVAAPSTGAAEAPQKRERGRPSKYTPEIAQQVFELMAQGYSLDGAAGMIGLSHDNMYRWQHEHPDFLEAVKSGRVAGTAWWEEKLRGIAGGKPGNPVAILFGLKNRSRAAHGWHHDVQKTEVTWPDGGAIQTENRTTIDAKALDPAARDALRAALKAAKGD